MKYTETEREIIKSFAYGYEPEKIAELYDMEIDDVKKMQESSAEAIEEKKNYLKEQGWL